MRYLILLFLLSYSLTGSSQTITRKWKTIDDVSGKPKSIIEIYQKGDKYFGKILKIFPDPGEDPNPLCDECSGKKKGEPIVGMEILTDMKFDADNQEYDSGEILDPESGSVYDCKLWIGEDQNLNVRGYLMFFYRTQKWLPYEG